MFSKNLKYYRLRNHLSKKDLADKAGVTAMAITNYEKGERKPNMDILKALSKALNVRISQELFSFCSTTGICERICRRVL